MAELTPRNDVRKAASEILRRVDQLIKAGEIDHSIREIIRAKEIDPSNVYVRAYEERLTFLKEEHDKNADRERTRKEAEEAARARDEERRRQLEEQARRAENPKHREQDRKPDVVGVKDTQATAQDIAKLPVASGPEADIAREHVYIKAFKNAWSTGEVVSRRVAILEQLGKELGISPERQHQLEMQVHADMRGDSTLNTILVIDDDDKMLFLVERMLVDHGFQVTGLSTSDEAYTLLKKWKPGLILCDVNLETSTMGGFSFFEKVRQFEHLRDVPFVFLTGLSDEVLVRTGKELGVDDYLTKPISEESLIATIKGKLRRFNDLRRKK